jgi:hypothetical protein
VQHSPIDFEMQVSRKTKEDWLNSATEGVNIVVKNTFVHVGKENDLPGLRGCDSDSALDRKVACLEQQQQQEQEQQQQQQQRQQQQQSHEVADPAQADAACHVVPTGVVCYPTAAAPSRTSMQPLGQDFVVYEDEPLTPPANDCFDFLSIALMCTCSLAE